MAVEEDDAPTRAPRRLTLRRIALAGGGLVLVGLVAAYLLLPRLVRPAVERALSAALGTPVSIAQLEWAPFAGRIVAERVALGGTGDGITAARLSIEGRPSALWHGVIALDRVVVDAPAGTLHLDAHYRPLLLPGLGGDAPARTTLPRITLQQLLVTDGALTVRYPVRRELRDAQLGIARLESSDIAATDGALQMRAQLTGSLDGAPLEVQARVRLAGAESDIEATGRVSGLAVDHRSLDLLPELHAFHTTLDARATYTSTTSPPRHTLQLDAQLHEPRLADDAGTEFAAQTVALPDVRLDLADGSLALDRVAIDRPVGTLQLDARYRPVLGGGGDAAAATPPHVSIAELVMTDGELTIRHPVKGRLRATPVHVTRLTCSDVELRPGRLRAHAHLTGMLDAAPVQVETRLQLGGADASVAASVDASGLAVDGDRFELPAGFETLRTTVDVRASYASQAAPALATVRAAARLGTPRLTAAGGSELAARAIALPDLRLDLLQRRIELGPVTLDAPALGLALTADGVALPWPSGATAGTSDWMVQSGAIDLRDGRLRIRRDATTLDLAVPSARWGGSAAGRSAPLALRATAKGGGSVVAAGTLGIDPFEAALDVRLTALPLPALAELAAPLRLHLANGTGDGRLRVTAHDGRLRVQGEAQLRDAHTAPPSSKRPAEVMAVNLAEAEFAYDSGASPPLDVASLTLAYPYVMVQRDADGTFPYSLLAAGDATPSRQPEPRQPQVRIGRLAVEDGKVEFVDVTLRRPFWTSLAHVAAEATAILLPAPATGSFTIAGKHDELSPLTISGTFDARGIEGHAALQDALLESLNAYVSPLLGYDVTAGFLSVDVRAAPAPPLYQATAKMVLRGVDVLQTGVDAVQRQSGVPLPIALSLIADGAGRIELTLPVALDTSSGRFTLGSVVGQAVRDAIVGALTSPLRILGSLFGTNGAPYAFAIDPIPFPAGAGVLDPAGTARIAEIARIMEAHPGLVLVATPQIVASELGALGAAAAQAVADARNEAVRDAFTGTGAAPRLPAERLMLVAWQPPSGEPPSGSPGVYVELQEQP